MLLQEEREDCYEARLHVRSADLVDARTYHLTVENDRGADSHTVLLAVRGEHEARASPSTAHRMAFHLASSHTNCHCKETLCSS